MAKHPITAFRESHGLTQTQLAEKLGVKGATVTRWENGNRRIDDDLVGTVADFTNIPVCKLRPDLVPLLKRMKREPVQ